MFAITHYSPPDQDLLIPAFLFGMFAMGFLWLIVYIINFNRDYTHERWIGGHCYTTRLSHRICGSVGDRIVSGHWIKWIESLWKTQEGYFFILRIDEFRHPEITPVSEDGAKKFISAVGG